MINLFMLCCACGFSACAGLGALQEDNHQEFKQQEKVEFKQDNIRFVQYNDEEYLITIESNELNNYVWNNFNNYFVNNDLAYEDCISSSSYNDTELVFAGNNGNSNGFTYFAVNYGATNNRISFNYDSANEEVLNTNHFYFNYDDEDIEMVYSLDLYCLSNHYNSIKSAIELDINANSTGQEDYQNALGQFVQILVGGIQSLATGVASGIVGMASALFLETDNGSVTGLSVFGGIVAIFAGLALAIALTTKVYTWVTSLGN